MKNEIRGLEISHHKYDLICGLENFLSHSAATKVNAVVVLYIFHLYPRTIQ